MAENQGFMGGLASGLQQGVNMGYLIQQARAMRENQMRQAQAIEIERQKIEFEKSNAALERGVSIFKELPKNLRPSFFNKNLSPMFKQVYGVDMGSVGFNDVVSKGIEDFATLIKLKQQGKLSQEEFMMQAAEIRSMVSKDESEQIGSIMRGMPGGQRPRGGFSADQRMGDFETRQFYKTNLGLKDAEIDEGIKTGKIAKNLTRGDAALLKKSGFSFPAGLFDGGGSQTGDQYGF